MEAGTRLSRLRRIIRRRAICKTPESLGQSRRFQIVALENGQPGNLPLYRGPRTARDFGHHRSKEQSAGYARPASNSGLTYAPCDLLNSSLPMITTVSEATLSSVPGSNTGTGSRQTLTELQNS